MFPHDAEKPLQHVTEHCTITTTMHAERAVMHAGRREANALRHSRRPETRKNKSKAETCQKVQHLKIT